MTLDTLSFADGSATSSRVTLSQGSTTSSLLRLSSVSTSSTLTHFTFGSAPSDVTRSMTSSVVTGGSIALSVSGGNTGLSSVYSTARSGFSYSGAGNHTLTNTTQICPVKNTGIGITALGGVGIFGGGAENTAHAGATNVSLTSGSGGDFSVPGWSKVGPNLRQLELFQPGDQSEA